MIRVAPLALAMLALTSCATVSEVRPPSLDALARQYLAVQLAIGEKEPGYVDAYYGPQELAVAATAQNDEITLLILQERVAALDSALGSLPVAVGSVEAERVRYLRAMLGSAKVRLRMLNGEKILFQDEAEGLFGVRPELIDLANLDPILAQIEALVPGDESDGPLHERLSAFQDRFIIPADRLRSVMEAAAAECRARTLPNIPLPANERFDLNFVTDKPWSGFNYYQGDYHSVIAINTDMPVRLGRAVHLGCHEAYPGHHVYGILGERDRVMALDQIEHTLLPLYSPTAMVAEGSAEYGVGLAFPGDSRFEFERDVLAPLAGIDARDLQADYDLRKATEGLTGAVYTIAAGYLDGTLTREETITANMRCRLVSRERAEKDLTVFDSARSYVINYGLGQDIIGKAVEKGGADLPTRWQRFINILKKPTLPEDLM